MAAGCKKCDPHEMCEECPEWIFTLADLIMCMMGLFVILWVLKPSPKETPQIDPEQIKVLAAIRDAFGYLPDPTSEDPIDIYLILKKLETLNPLKGPGDGGKSELEQRAPQGTDPEVTSIRLGTQSTTGGRLIFDSGSDVITPATASVLDEIARIIRGHRNIVMVKGHASLDDYDHDVPMQQKMDLSVRRAQAAADYLVSRGVEPDILRVQGCSTFEPVIQRTYTPNGQSLNRRVEVEVMATLVAEFQDRPATQRIEAHAMDSSATDHDLGHTPETAPPAH